MKKILAILIFLFFSQNSIASPSRNLSIFAEPNMAVALTKIARIYSQKNNIIVSLNFASAADLMMEIDSGEPINIFISANPEPIESLRNKGLVDVYNIVFFAEDELVLVSSKNNKTNLILPEQNLSLYSALTILNNNKSSLIIDDVTSSSGKFSEDFIKKAKLNDLKILQRVAEDGGSIADLAAMSEHYALMLKSQAYNKKDLQILVDKKDGDIFYQALVIAGDNMDNAREFLKFLKTHATKDILRSSGLKVE